MKNIWIIWIPTMVSIFALSLIQFRPENDKEKFYDEVDTNSEHFRMAVVNHGKLVWMPMYYRASDDFYFENGLSESNTTPSIPVSTPSHPLEIHGIGEMTITPKTMDFSNVTNTPINSTMSTPREERVTFSKTPNHLDFEEIDRTIHINVKPGQRVEIKVLEEGK